MSYVLLGTDAGLSVVDGGAGTTTATYMVSPDNADVVYQKILAAK